MTELSLLARVMHQWDLVQNTINNVHTAQPLSMSKAMADLIHMQKIMNDMLVAEFRKSYRTEDFKLYQHIDRPGVSQLHVLDKGEVTDIIEGPDRFILNELVKRYDQQLGVRKVK